MNIVKRLYDYVELPTKLASVIPFFAAMGFCLFHGYAVNARDSLLFFAAMLLFDMATTMINNYIDHKQAGKQGHFSRGIMLALIFCAVLPAALIGLYLSWLYGPVFLLAGIFCFIVGVAYTFGPMPISRSPFSELFSGFTMGLVLPFLVVTINMPPLVELKFNNWEALVTFDVFGLIKFLLACAPLVFCISNIMLANNTCDLQADKATRYTMPRHIGAKNAVKLFAVLYFLCYIAIAASWAIGAIPWVCLFVLLTAVPVFRNVKRFSQKQVKAETFVLAIKNFLLILAPYALGIFMGAMLH